MLPWRAWPTDLASGVRENWLSADVITMALSRNEAHVPEGLLAIARNLQTRFPDRDPKFFDPLFGAERARSFQGASSIAAEPDRRGFVRGAVRYLDQEQNQANDESMPSAV